jgi:hypothetical protein
MNITHDKKGRAILLEVSWSIEDVIWKAKDRKIKLSLDEASEIMGHLYKHHDCNIGVNWDVIDYWIDEAVAERKAK